jgi:glycosyltransferase involved in cell wall biosynthesis
MLTTLVHVNLAALVARRLSGVSTRLIVREANYVSINRTKIDFAPVRLAYQLIPWVYPWADRIIAVSQGVREDLLKCSGLPRDRVVVLPNPVVTPELTAKAAEPVDHAWLVEGQPPVVLGVGRLVPQKDFATLIRAFAVVHGRRRARLVILGEGPVRLALEHQVRDLGLEADVALPGFANNPYAWMVRASVFVLSSAWEGSPNVLVEAMACGTPVVATDCPSGSREILMDGKFGTLVPVGDVTAMAEAIFTTLDHPPGPGLARQRAEAFAVDRVVGQYLRVLLGEKPV